MRDTRFCQNPNCPSKKDTKGGFTKVGFKTDSKSNPYYCPHCQTALPDYVTPTSEPVTEEESFKPLGFGRKKGERKMKNGKKHDIGYIATTILFCILLAALIVAVGFVIRNLAVGGTKVPVATTAIPTPAPTIAPTTAPTDGEYITVFRGENDQETINFDDAWPGFYAADSITWKDTSFHMLGGTDTDTIGLKSGTYTVEEDGIVSGDVWVNDVKICDDNENTFLVIQVKKGDKVTVVNDWKAWFTSHYEEDLVVAARQAAHPDWIRQDSELN